MKRLLLIFSFLLAFYVNGQTYEVLTVSSGYTDDVIANGSGAANASSTIGVDDANFAYISQDFVSPAGATAPAGALPTNGTVTSSVAGLTHQFGDYSANNSLRLPNTNQNGTLIFMNQVQATELYFLVTSGSGSSVVSAQIQFTDGTNQLVTGLNVPDWYNGVNPPVELQGVGRVNRNNSVIETPFNNPRVYRMSVAVSAANQIKFISGVQFTKTSGSGVANIFTASAQLLDSCPAPDGLTATSVSTDQATIQWNTPVIAPGSYEYYYSTSNTAPNSGTTPSGTETGTSTTLLGLASTTAYYVWVRSVCSGTETSGWAGPLLVETEMCPVSEQCSYTVNMTDTWGDGWNGNSMDFIQNGIVVANVTLTSGSNGSQTVYLCDNVPFTIHWNDGSFEGEVGMTVVSNVIGQTVFTLNSGSGSLSGSDIFTGLSECSNSCAGPTDLAVSLDSVTATATVTWTAGASETEWQVLVLPAGSPYPFNQTGAVVNTPSFDINNVTSLTDYDIYVLSVCGPGDTSYWTGPLLLEVGLLNDECAAASFLPVNSDDTCTQVVTVQFDGVTVSSEPDDCASQNSGDIWFTFTASSTVHQIEMVNPNPGNLEGDFDEVILTLYDGSCGSLTALYCTAVNNILATDLQPGVSYLVRVTDNTPANNADTIFDLCVNTPTLPANQDSFDCSIRTINSDFETPVVNGIYPPQVEQYLVQGWRTTAADGLIEVWPDPNYWTTPVTPAYSGNQFIELNANAVGGVYQDYNTPASTTFTFGFAHRGRSGTDTCEVLTGPPGGPYVSIGTYSTGNTSWSYYTGTHTTPDNQPVTRFIFQAVSTSGGNPTVGNFLDAISFTANNGIITDNPLTIECEDVNVSLQANGGGSWVVMPGNPSETVIANPDSNNTTVSGFTVPGTYYYEWAGAYCSSVLEIVFDAYVVEFSYDVDALCYDEASVMPTLADGFSMGGTFSAENGLVIDPVTGEIDVVASTPGTYTVTYDLPDTIVTNCDTTYSVPFTIYPPVNVAIEEGCVGVAYMLTAVPTNTTDLTNVTFEWSGPMGFAESTQEVQAIYEGDYTVVVTSADGCVTSTTATVESTYCAIPQGISPQGDEFNQSFDLTGLNVSKIEVFNRLGTEVYSETEYSNQWHGQTDKGELLPVGTYFYVLYFSDDKETMTGWVYVNY